MDSVVLRVLRGSQGVSRGSLGMKSGCSNGGKSVKAGGAGLRDHREESIPGSKTTA